MTAACQENGSLLTGDGQRRKVVTARNVRVHRVLWIVDGLHAAGACEAEFLISAIEFWRDDRSVFLPNTEIEKRLRTLLGMLVPLFQNSDRN